jgi:hypothetical protein
MLSTKFCLICTTYVRLLILRNFFNYAAILSSIMYVLMAKVACFGIFARQSMCEHMFVNKMALTGLVNI